MTYITPKAKPIFLAAAFVLCFLIANKVSAQTVPAKDPRVKEMINAMNRSADEWNKGNLQPLMDLYDASATMSTPNGLVGLDGIRAVYEKYYFVGKMPRQNLRYTDMKVRFLGKDYALLTGGFTLYGNNLPERSGRYSLVMARKGKTWKILHDHSG
jgi:ketosteroid isomerase-like protein